MPIQQGKKHKLASLIMGSPLGILARRRKLKNLSVLAYHRIFPIQPDYPFNPELISASPETFRRQLELIDANFNVINFMQLDKFIKEGARIPPNSLILTFDDGYSDNYELMLPILKEFGMTAVIYVSTDYIGSERLFWFDELAYLVANMPNKKLSLLSGRFQEVLTSDNREKVRVNLGLFAQRISDQQRLEVLIDLRKAAEVSVDPEHFKMARPLRWSELETLRDAGVEIGSHAKNHGFLDQMTPDEIKEQVADSKAVLENKLGIKVYSFSYPNGNYHPGVVEAVLQAGYPYAVSYHHAVQPLCSMNRHLISRIHVELDVDMSLFAANLFLPEIFVR